MERRVSENPTEGNGNLFRAEEEERESTYEVVIMILSDFFSSSI